MAEVNYLAVIVAAALAFAVGGAWYSPALFAGAWMAAHGYTPDKMAEMKRANPPARAMAVTAVCQVVMAAVLARLMLWAGVSGLLAGLAFGVFLWLGFAATVALIANMFSDRPIRVFVIESGYQLVSLTLMGAVIGAWR